MTRLRITTVIILAVAVMTGACAHRMNNGAERAPAEKATSADAYYHYSLGVYHELNANYDQAIREYETTLRIDPWQPSVTVALAQLYVRNDNITKAVEILEKSNIYHQDYLDAYLLLGSLYVKLQESDNAIKAFTHVIQSDPKRVEPYLYLSLLYRDRKEYEKAVANLKEFLTLEPANLMGHYYMAKIYADMSRYDEAETWLKKTLDIKPFFASALVDLAVLYELQNRPGDAVDVYRRLIEANPSGMEARFKLGKAYLDLKRYDEAESEFRSILNRDKANLDARFSLGLVYFFKGTDFEAAIREFQSVLAKDPFNDQARYFLASSCEENGDHVRAFTEFEKIPPGSKLYESARIQMGIILRDGGLLSEAIDLVRTALDEKGTSGELIGFLAALHEENGDLETAEGMLKRGLLLLPQSPDLRYRLGVLYENTGRHEESMKEMEEVLRIDENNAEALNFIGYSYADRGINLDEAQRMIRKALRLKPDNGFIIDSLGWLYFRKNNIDLAIQYLEKALSLIPDDPTITEHLGDAYARAGLYRKALSVYRKALKLKPKDRKTLMAKIREVAQCAARQGQELVGGE